MFDFKKTIVFLFLASFFCTAQAEVFVYDRVGVLTAAISVNSKSAVYAMDASHNISAASSSQPLGGAPGGQILLTATPAPFTNPASTAISAKVNLTSLGGNATAALRDAGTNGDVTAGDGTFSLLANISADTPLGAQLLAVTYTDALPSTFHAALAACA